MNKEKQQTALLQLKSTIKDGIGNINGQLNDYKSGYKQCLIDIENLIDKQLLEMEKRQHWATWGNGVANAENEKLFKDYWNDTYGGNK
jgi:hypothetical protein